MTDIAKHERFSGPPEPSAASAPQATKKDARGTDRSSSPRSRADREANIPGFVDTI